MAKLLVKTLNISANPSGAAAAARQGNVVMIVDLIDMSTTAESALEAGAIEVMGASPDQNNNEVPVSVNPEKIGYIAGKKALKNKTGVIVAAEPRLITGEEEESRLDSIQYVLKGIERSGAVMEKIVANLGKDVCKMADFENKILVVVSAAGGTAYDAAYNYGAAEVITGTIARTNKMSGNKPAKLAAERAVKAAKRHKSGITIVASSSNSMEDMLAAEYICKEILNTGFLKLNPDNTKKNAKTI